MIWLNTSWNYWEIGIPWNLDLIMYHDNPSITSSRFQKLTYFLSLFASYKVTEKPFKRKSQGNLSKEIRYWITLFYTSNFADYLSNTFSNFNKLIKRQFRLYRFIISRLEMTEHEYFWIPLHLFRKTLWKNRWVSSIIPIMPKEDRLRAITFELPHWYFQWEIT